PVSVHVLERRVPGGRCQGHVPGIWAMGGHAALQGDVLVVGSRLAVRERLELVVALARQVVLGIAIAGEVLAGDAHPPDPQGLPALITAVQPRRDAGLDPPELLLAILAVVVAVVGDAEVPAAGAIPIAEQHRQRAEAW